MSRRSRLPLRVVGRGGGVGALLPGVSLVTAVAPRRGDTMSMPQYSVPLGLEFYVDDPAVRELRCVTAVIGVNGRVAYNRIRCVGLSRPCSVFRITDDGNAISMDGHALKA